LSRGKSRLKLYKIKNPWQATTSSPSCGKSWFVFRICSDRWQLSAWKYFLGSSCS